MKMTMGDAHNLYAELVHLDGDTNLKLNDATREAIIVNLDILRSRVQAYEKVRAIRYKELREAGLNQAGIYARDEALFNTEITLRDIERREQEEEFPELRMIKLGDLKPAKGDQYLPNKLALKPMIEDWPT